MDPTWKVCPFIKLGFFLIFVALSFFKNRPINRGEAKEVDAFLYKMSTLC